MSCGELPEKGPSVYHDGVVCPEKYFIAGSKSGDGRIGAWLWGSYTH